MAGYGNAYKGLNPNDRITMERIDGELKTLEEEYLMDNKRTTITSSMPFFNAKNRESFLEDEIVKEIIQGHEVEIEKYKEDAGKKYNLYTINSYLKILGFDSDKLKMFTNWSEHIEKKEKWTIFLGMSAIITAMIVLFLSFFGISLQKLTDTYLLLCIGVLALIFLAGVIGAGVLVVKQLDLKEENEQIVVVSVAAITYIGGIGALLAYYDEHKNLSSQDYVIYSVFWIAIIYSCVLIVVLGFDVTSKMLKILYEKDPVRREAADRRYKEFLEKNIEVVAIAYGFEEILKMIVSNYHQTPEIQAQIRDLENEKACILKKYSP